MAGRLARIDGRQDSVRTDQLGALGGIVFGIEPFERDLAKIGIGKELGAVLKGQTLGLDLMMQAGRGLEAHAR